jgi:hypothetical protein
MNYYDTIIQTHQDSLDGGSSLHNTLLTKPTDGFMVSVYGHEYSVPADCSIGEYISAWMSVQKRAEAIQLREGIHTYVGTWLHDGHIVFDVSYNIPAWADAQVMGLANKQKAVYDVENSKDIFLSPPDDTDDDDYDAFDAEIDLFINERYRDLDEDLNP